MYDNFHSCDSTILGVVPVFHTKLLVALLGGRVRLLASSCLHLKSAATAIRNVAKRILSKSDVGKCENLGALLKHQGQQFFNFFDSKEAHLSDPAVMVIVAHDLATSHSFGRLAYKF